MKLWDIIKEYIREELSLIKDVERYRAIAAARIITLCVLVILGVAVQQVLVGKISFDIGFVLGIFSIFISWLFYWAADRSSQQQITNLKEFLRDFKAASDKRFDTIQAKLEGVYIEGSTAPSPPPPQNGNNIANDFAKSIAAIMKSDVKQILIALHIFQKRINENAKLEYAFELKETVTNGFTSLVSLRKDLSKAGLIEFNAGDDTVGLSVTGQQFADWLINNGEKASYYESPLLGSWGTPSPRFLEFRKAK